jgi:hypothetical protein
VPLHLCQRCLCLGQPEGHVHGAVQVDRRGQLGASLLVLIGLDVEGTEPQVTMCLQRAHAEFSNQGKGLAIVCLGLLRLQRHVVHGDVAEEPQGPCLVAAFMQGTGERERPLSEGLRVLQTASQ